MQSGLAYTILRPGRLTDGPYTSFDLNTLLQATAGTRQDIQVSARDELNGETSRIALAGMRLVMRMPCALRTNCVIHTSKGCLTLLSSLRSELLCQSCWFR